MRNTILSVTTGIDSIRRGDIGGVAQGVADAFAPSRKSTLSDNAAMEIGDKQPTGRALPPIILGAVGARGPHRVRVSCSPGGVVNQFRVGRERSRNLPLGDFMPGGSFKASQGLDLYL